MIVGGVIMKASLSNNARFSIFYVGKIKNKFKTSPFLQKYISISKWNDGYIECLAKYSTVSEPLEEYIDLRFIAERLRLPKNIFQNITEVEIV